MMHGAELEPAAAAGRQEAEMLSSSEQNFRSSTASWASLTRLFMASWHTTTCADEVRL